MKHSILVAVASVMTLTACAGPDGSSLPDASTPPVTAAPAGPVTSQRAAADAETLRGYTLDMDKLDRVFAAQMNLVKAIAALTPAERAEMEAASASSSTDGLAEVVAKLDANAIAKKAVTDAGISTREYITASMAMMQASMAHSVLQTRPNDNQDSLALTMDTNPANVKFVRDNIGELTRKQEAMAAEMSRTGLSSGQ